VPVAGVVQTLATQPVATVEQHMTRVTLQAFGTIPARDSTFVLSSLHVQAYCLLAPDSYRRDGHRRNRPNGSGERRAEPRRLRYRREMTLSPASPMIAVSAAVLPTSDEWSYEVKWGGCRSLVLKDVADVRLVSRNSKNPTAQYPAIAAAVGNLNLKTAILDGEVVAVDRDGRPSFQALQHASIGYQGHCCG
jgi:ATP-dependent DNA ligase